MPQDSYPFPMYSGLLDPEHYKRIGSAIWLFLWCVSSTTAEKEKEGVVWGIVLGNKPVRLPELEEQFSVSNRTIRDWIKKLEDHEYIRVTRAPYGLIFSVRKSKKFHGKRSAEMRHSPDRDRQNTATLEGGDRQKSADLSEEICRSNKDITEDITKDVVVVDEAEMMQQIQDIENHFLKRRGKGFSVSPNDYVEIQQLVAAGVPSPLIKSCIDRAFDEFRPRHIRDEIRSISFIIPRIYDEWEKQRASKAITGAVPHVQVALGSPKRTKQQQQQFDELDQLIAEEEKKRGTD